jgi:hypothetical protein
LPVCPTWNWCGYQPASVAAREAPTAAPSESASFSISAKFSALPTPRPAGDHDGCLGQIRPLAALRHHRSVMCAALAASLSSVLAGSSAGRTLGGLWGGGVRPYRHDRRAAPHA